MTSKVTTELDKKIIAFLKKYKDTPVSHRKQFPEEGEFNYCEKYGLIEDESLNNNYRLTSKGLETLNIGSVSKYLNRRKLRNTVKIVTATLVLVFAAISALYTPFKDIFYNPSEGVNNEPTITSSNPHKESKGKHIDTVTIAPPIKTINVTHKDSI